MMAEMRVVMKMKALKLEKKCLASCLADCLVLTWGVLILMVAQKARLLVHMST